MLDFEICDAARLRRDPAYDGRFFTGVHTTGIYCRPICPVRPALTKNVSYYPSAAAAEAAGFRPCLRCRPETAPFSPAWRGSRTTVDRAMRLIEDGALDRHGIEDLAEILGVGGRHLHRLFQQHLGASPGQVARTARLQRAKRLVDQTDLPFAQVALDAGYSSVRRFNDAFRSVYGRPPSALRKRRSRRQTDPEVPVSAGRSLVEQSQVAML